MPCQWIKLADGTVVHLKIGGRNSGKRCAFCKTGYSERLCDFVVGLFGETCDAEMCVRCATRVAPEVDHCPKHSKGPTA